MTRIRQLSTIAILLFLSACASHNAGHPTGTAPTPTYKVGQPYQISGNWYYPAEDYSYDETGIASWYGQDFHNQVTANGEIFNKNELTAAHKTLPLPTLARITNLDNGRSIVVRINDRGPFSGARIIDVSQRAAQLLGFEQQGTAKVRVQVLADESKAIADAMRHYGSSTPTQFAAAAPASNAVTSETLEPVQTTPAIHQQLLATRPVAEAVQVPVTGPHPIYIQAGSFTILENATKLQQKLSVLGHASISNAVVNGKQFYRVRIGPVPDVDHADALLARVRHEGMTGARTVVD